jgi:UDP-N-acetylmuramate dehydrogenase
MIIKNASLKDRCSYHTGGAAEFFAEPEDADQLRQALLFAGENSLEVTVLGSGCNVLVSDEGVRGLVISTGRLAADIRFDDVDVYAGAGVILDELVRQSVINGLDGLVNMSGIPGSVGGAVIMNAGAFGTEIKDTAARIDMCGMDGNIYAVDAADAGFGYRRADNLKGIVTGCLFRLKKDDPEKLMLKRAEILGMREQKQPLDFPSCGSVFKRPEGNFAGTLIEKCGLKGFSIGGAQVSEKHANFIINRSDASSKDIYDLINHVQRTVYEKTGVMLEKEVKFIGFQG